MTTSVAVALLMFFPVCVHSQIKLEESEGGLKPSGDAFQLTCTASGFSVTSYGVSWLYQPTGKGPQWMGIQWGGGSLDYNAALRSRISITRDPAKNQVYLQVNNAVVEDSGTYYCAIQYAAAAAGLGFDYWGQGTFVTVTTASQSAPSLFPLISSDYASAEDITVGCLAKDFLPDSLIFSWQKPNNESLEAEKIRRFPSISNSDGAYTTCSEATIPANQWDAYKPFFCKAQLASETRVARVVRQTPSICEEPTIIVRVPPLDDFQGAYLNATLLCKADNLHTEKTTLKWLKDGIVLSSGFTTSAPIKQSRGGYSIISELIVTKREWFANKVFSCQVQNEKFDEIRNASKPLVCEDCGGPNMPVRVETIPPAFADIYVTKSAKLTCRTSNIPFTEDLADLNVTWIRQPTNKPVEILETNIGQAKEQEDRELVFVDATTTVCVEDWNSGDTFQCKVTFHQLASTETRTLKKENGGSRSPPSVYVLPPSSEQLALKETATLTCLVKDFYPNSFFVQWLQNNELVGVSEYHTSDPIQESKSPERYFTYSTLSVSEQDWSSGATYTCVVGHEALPLQTTQKTIDKNTGKPTFVNVSLVLSDMTSSCY